MRQRALIHIAGPAGGGKTALVVALLRGLGGVVTCVRAERDDSLCAPEEEAPKTHRELRRYAAAGACAVAHYRFPGTHADHEALYLADFMQSYSVAVLIEGDCPLPRVDLGVFVAGPLPAGAPLLVRVQRDHSAEQASSLDAWEQALASSETFARFLTRDFGESLIGVALTNPALLAELRVKAETELARLRAAPAPEPTEHWAIAPGYEGVERAQLVVINAGDEEQRKHGEIIVQEVARLRLDKEAFKDVIGLHGNRLPVTAVVARLADPKDPGLKKALMRVQRTIRRHQ